MTNILFIGDPHIKLDNSEDFSAFQTKLYELIEKLEDLSLIVVGGDVLDYHEKVYTQCLNRAISFIKELSEYAPTYVLVGNHDYISNSQFLTENHWMNALKPIENVIVVDRVIRLDNILFVPYVPIGRMVEALSTEKDWKKASIIFGHCEIKGCKMGMGIFRTALGPSFYDESGLGQTRVSEKGDVWNEDWPLLVSGHIHNNQWVGSNVYYPGTPFQHTFGDTDKKVVAYISLSDPVKLEGPTVQEYDLGLEKKQILLYEIDKIDQLENIPDRNPKHTRVKVKCNNSEKKAFKESSTYKSLVKKGVSIKFVEEKVVIEEKVTSYNVWDILKDMIDKEKNEYLTLDYNSIIKS